MPSGEGTLRSGVSLNLQLFVSAGSVELTAFETQSMFGCSHSACSRSRSKQGEVSVSYCNLVFLLFHFIKPFVILVCLELTKVLVLAWFCDLPFFIMMLISFVLVC